ncbi:Origin recognition complex subunit like [Actinidia chinensis var. chinensis]|uniref:Origin recognition complex subunit like n=1 Tax=Actinidia chinensis var. chinensis TaxID=1590841 RepID=A0A2R6QAS8_ACTCC|nr:Origin recognition complex subunit like [Actinidia chinensis var. chinensis]
MVVKMMKWRPWPPLPSKKFEAKIMIRRVEGLCLFAEKGSEIEEFSRLGVEIKWKGSKGNGLSYLRRSVRRNCTREEGLREDGVVEWNEEFRSVCSFSAYKEGLFHPWEVAFTVLNGLNHRPTNKVSAVGTASFNLAEFASVNEEKELEISIPLSIHGGCTEPNPSLCLSISILELKSAQEPSEMVLRPVSPLPLSPCSADALPTEKDEDSALKASLRKVKVFTEYVSSRRAKKACCEEEGSDGKSSVRSEDAEYNYPFDTDSLDDPEEGESEEVKEDSSVQKSVSYGSLAYANFAGASFYSNASNSEDEDWIYYSHRRSDVGCLNVEDLASVLEHSLRQSSKRSILPWKRRKLSFRSPKPKGEPLLKKDYGEEGGDDIDFDRRQLSSSDESSFGRHKVREDSTANRSSVSEFGDDNFAVGCWENKEVISRDGHMKLQTQVFFASIDQRSERAAGESACTALVAVIADWFQSNRDQMPIKSQLDSLIREGSLEWRNLCENVTYRERFPDKHFDLETVLEAKVRPLCVVPEKSFIGFFHPEGLKEVEGFDFLHSAMSFDNIWDEISRSGSENRSNADPLVYIVSWNDHFFVLKVEHDAYYIIDTLGERLYEGCDRAYVLKFDKNTTIRSLPKETQSSDENSASEQCKNPEEASSGETEITTSNESGTSEEEDSVVSIGKEACKEYIKSFLAAIPIRELQVDLKKGLMASTPLHHRLQIEFHYTRCLQPVAQSLLIEATADALAISELVV